MHLGATEEHTLKVGFRHRTKPLAVLICEEAAGSTPSGWSTAGFRKTEKYFRPLLCKPCVPFLHVKNNPSKQKAKAMAVLDRVNDLLPCIIQMGFILKYSQVKITVRESAPVSLLIF